MRTHLAWNRPNHAPVGVLLLGLLALAGLGTPAMGRVWISEFLADNDGSFLNDQGKATDWIELFNDGDQAVNLSGWSLSDDATDPRQWVFPTGTTIGPKQFMLIFASGEDRRDPSGPLHTNFGLRRGGEYLGLFRAGTPTVEHDFGASYPPQFEGISYGLTQTGGVAPVLVQGAAGQAAVPTSAAQFEADFANWQSSLTNLTGSNWRDVTTGVGYDTDSRYGPWLSATGDFLDEMRNKNSSIFLRVPFQIPAGETISSLSLRMRYDDGFVAYVNGVRVGSDRAPQQLEWNSEAFEARNDGLNDEWETIAINPGMVNLQTGTNILAIHGMNVSASSGDMLVLPELDRVSASAVTGSPLFLTNTSPGGVNGAGATSVPAQITSVTRSFENRPTGGAGSAPLPIVAVVSKGSNRVVQTRIFYRKMFEAEQGPFVMAGGGIDGGTYTFSVPTTNLQPGEMVRWRVEVLDAGGGVSKSPAFKAPLDADEYFGTVAADSSFASSQIPVMETFVPPDAEMAVDTRGGGRVSVFYLNQFYDNVQMDLHGQSTAEFPKKSYDLDFNRGNRFLWKEGERRVKDTNLLTNWADKSKVRNTVTYEFLRRAGAGWHYAFPIRVQRNGAFFATTDMVEDGDDRFLERIGLDPEGALYKMYDDMSNISEALKKTRQEEDKSDMQALISGLRTGPIQRQRLFLYDNIDVAATVNHLAALWAGGISDTGHKNYYMFRDTNGTKEWRPIPWDVDLSIGRRWRPQLQYFDDNLDVQHQNWLNANPLWDAVHNWTELRPMFLRRFQTLRDDVLQRNGVQNDWYKDKINEVRFSIDPPGVANSDADLDYEKWGSWGNRFDVDRAARRILNTYLPARRNFLFGNRTIGGTPVPRDQRPTPRLAIETVEALPTSGNQKEEFIVIRNQETQATDLSGFTISGGITHTFPPGTVLPGLSQVSGVPNGGRLYLAKDAAAFRDRSQSPKGRQSRFVQGGYKGQLSARGETIVLANQAGTEIDRETYQATPTPSQVALRLIQFDYHPVDPSTAEMAALPGAVGDDYEYLVLKNISGSSVDLTGLTFTDGIVFSFAADAMLADGASLVVAKNPAAYAVRFPSDQRMVVGPYQGSLSNDGETVRLTDGLGENVMTFTYNDRWFPASDGQGSSIAVADEAADPRGFSNAMAWLSVAPDGTRSTHFNAFQTSNFAREAYETTGAPTADPDGDGRSNWEEYAFGTNPMVADSVVISATTDSTANGRKMRLRVKRRADAGDIDWNLQRGTDLEGWQNVASTVTDQTGHSDGTETVSYEATMPTTEARSFTRLLGSQRP